MLNSLKQLFSALVSAIPEQEKTTQPNTSSEAWKNMAIKPSQRHYDEDEEQGRLFLIELQAMLEDCDLFNPLKISDIIQWFKQTRIQFQARSANEFNKVNNLDDFLTTKGLNEVQNAYKYFYTMILIASHRAHAIVEIERRKSLGIKLLEGANKLEIDNCLNNQNIIKKYFGKKVDISAAPILPLRSCYKCPNGHTAPITFRAVLPFE